METTAKRYKIPQDMLMDILRILFSNNIRHKIEGIKQKDNIIILQVYFTDNEPIKNAKKNIEGILQDYSEYMKGLLGDDILFMDEETDEQD